MIISTQGIPACLPPNKLSINYFYIFKPAEDGHQYINKEVVVKLFCIGAVKQSVCVVLTTQDVAIVNVVKSSEIAICLFVITFHACNISEMLTVANDLSNIKVFLCVSTVVLCLFYYLKVIGNIESGNSRLSS